MKQPRPTKVWIVLDSDGTAVAAMEYEETAILLAAVIGGAIVEAIAMIVVIDGQEMVDLTTAECSDVCDDCRADQERERAFAAYAHEHRN